MTRATTFAHTLAECINDLLRPVLIPVAVGYFLVRGGPYLVERIAADWALPAAPALTLRATPASLSMAVPVSIRIAGDFHD